MNASGLLSADDLVDPYAGIIRAVHPVQRLDALPKRYIGLTAEIADTRTHGNWPSDLVSLGTTFGDPGGARIAAIGEAVERYCGNYVPGHLLRATPRTLGAEGIRHLGPQELNFFASWQYDTPGFPFEQFTQDTSIAWCKGVGDDGRPTLVPASLVYLNWRTGGRKREPWLHHLNYAGIATGAGLDDAASRGLLELIERDSLSLWWHLNLPARGIDLRSVPGLLDDLGDTRLRCHLLELPSYFGVPVVAAVIHDPELGIVAGGFSAKLDPVQTARKAVLEAIHSWVFTRGLLEPDGWVFGSMDAGVLARGLYLDHRADRSYLDAAGARSEHIRDLGAQAQVWLDPRTHKALLTRFTEPAQTVDIGELPTGDMAALKTRLRAGGHDIVVCDITTPDIALTSLRVARVCATGLIPNAPAAFPYFGLARWKAVAQKAGAGANPDDPDSLLLVPPPSL
ncbi:YcaO-like family protein [Gordonia rubripertincta]|uniref:YcaO-like family protein n=1 Tax=Gordonia rubripertincta TaxID=36822 RepID=A0ABT4MWH3_GORRU|nr:YcaO-like family protein [Gordonia rubripertincta]MCZ4551360.1 YcaO-like family protein [Gordonia rubripertincta]